MTVRKKNRQEYERDTCFRAQFTAVDRYLTEKESGGSPTTRATRQRQAGEPVNHVTR